MEQDDYNLDSDFLNDFDDDVLPEDASLDDVALDDFCSQPDDDLPDDGPPIDGPPDGNNQNIDQFNRFRNPHLWSNSEMRTLIKIWRTEFDAFCQFCLPATRTSRGLSHESRMFLLDPYGSLI